MRNTKDTKQENLKMRTKKIIKNNLKINEEHNAYIQKIQEEKRHAIDTKLKN